MFLNITVSYILSYFTVDYYHEFDICFVYYTIVPPLLIL